jgi:hypothetical protein
LPRLNNSSTASRARPDALRRSLDPTTLFPIDINLPEAYASEIKMEMDLNGLFEQIILCFLNCQEKSDIRFLLCFVLLARCPCVGTHAYYTDPMRHEPARILASGDCLDDYRIYMMSLFPVIGMIQETPFYFYLPRSLLPRASSEADEAHPRNSYLIRWHARSVRKVRVITLLGAQSSL